ncbi:MAG: pilus assembly protein N-terminal domain-containing protein [Pseudomonadota bacterium]
MNGLLGWNHIRMTLQAGVLAALVATPATAIAADGVRDPVKVTIDRAKVVRIARSADTVIVGNPAIADATIQDAQTIVLTGRSFGVTNLIVLDADGDPVVDETIVVNGHEHNTVRIYRQAVRETLACSPVCQPTLTMGDDQVGFQERRQQVEQRGDLIEKAVGGN